MPADPVHGADDQRDHADLHAEEQRRERRLREVEPEIEPGQGQHQDEAGQHEAEPGEQAAEPPAGQHADMDAKLVRLRPRQHLIDGEQAVEAGAGQPLLLLDQLVPDHRDLRDRAAPGEQAEAQEAKEDLPGRERRRGGLGGRCHASPLEEDGDGRQHLSERISASRADRDALSAVDQRVIPAEAGTHAPVLGWAIVFAALDRVGSWAH